MSNILIKNGTILTMDSKLLKGDILIENDKIVDVAPRIDTIADKEIDAKNRLVMPGFVNAHTHVGMSLFRGMLSDASTTGNVKQKIAEIESKLTGDDVKLAAELSIIEMIRSGTTTFCDSFTYEDEIAQVVRDTGIRAVLSRCVSGDAETAAACLAEAEDLYNNWNDKADGRIKVVLSLDSSRNCSPEAIRSTVELAKKLNTQIHMHYLETKDEINSIKQKYNRIVTDYLKTNNLFDVSTVLSHAVWADEIDLAELQFHDVSIVSNPICNCMQGSGIADVKFLVEGGINVALGTCGQESGFNLDMFETMRQIAYTQKLLYKDQRAIDSKKVLEMATIKGAKALKLAQSIGTIEKGKKADIIIVDINKPQFMPLHNVYTALAYSATESEVETTIVNGKVLMENKKLTTIDEEEVYRKVKDLANIMFI